MPVPDPDYIDAARRMAAEDAWWIADAVLSSRGAGADKQGVIPLLLAGHVSRIVHEGAELMRSKTAGEPAAAAALPTGYKQVIAKARHAVKLFDDHARPYQTLLTDMDGYLAGARAEFLGNTPHLWARRFECDLGMYRLNRRTVLGVTPTIAYRMGEPPATTAAQLAAKAMSYFDEQGRTLAAIATALRHPFDSTPTLTYMPLRYISSVDRRSGQYLARSYDPTYPEALKLVLLHVECDLNTLRHVLPVTATGHSDPVFRATVVTVYHGLSALQHAHDNHPATSSPQAARLHLLLGSPARNRLASDHGRLVRNRCTHYEIPNGQLTSPLDPTQPMNGIIDALPGGRPYADYLTDLHTVLDEASELLNGWHSR